MSPSQISMTVDQLRKLQAGGKVKARFAGASKYHAQPQRYQGQHFASKAELAFKLHLDHLKALGRVAWYTRQVPFYLPGSETVPAKRYVCDFLVMDCGYVGAPLVHIIDVKGQDTPTSKVKRSVIQATHGIAVEVIKATYRQGQPCFTWRL